MYEPEVNRIRCDTCGQFMKAQKGTSWMFVPDSAVSFEEEAIQCVSCTTKYGPPLPFQNVRIDVCSGLN